MVHRWQHFPYIAQTDARNRVGYYNTDIRQYQNVSPSAIKLSLLKVLFRQLATVPFA